MKETHFIPFSRPSIDQAEIAAVTEVLSSTWINTGPKVRAFEQAFSEYIGVKHAIAVTSCTAALHLSLVATGVGAGDEVITTPYTFTATSEAIRYVGAKPVFVDVEPRTLNMNVDNVEEKITSRTKAVVPVHIAGLPCDMDELISMCRNYDLALIDDAAHAVPSLYKSQHIGSLGDLSAFSFYANKNLTTGDGGMVTTNDTSLAQRVRTMRLHGIDRDAWIRQSQRSRWRYNIVTEGFKYNMIDIQAAIGLCQLEKLDRHHEKRTSIAEMYDRELADFDQISTPAKARHGDHAWHLYIIQLHSKNRDAFIDHLREANIECSVHYMPLHMFGFYQRAYGYQLGDFPCAEEAFERVVSLPLYPGLTEGDIRAIINVIKTFFDR